MSSFLQVQAKLEKQTGFDCTLSGSTVVGLYQKENTTFFANAGDSRAIIIGESVRRSEDYMPERGMDGNYEN